MEPVLLQALSGIPEVHTGPGSAAGFVGALHGRWHGRSFAVVTGAGCLARGGAPAAVLRRVLAGFPGSIHLVVAGEPSDAWVDQGRDRVALAGGVDAVLSIGGGSALDAGKALAVMLEETGPTLDLLEGVGRKKPSGRMKPWYAVPTTAGTGSEASTNAVLSRPGIQGFKKSLRHPALLAQGVVLDADMIIANPPRLAAMGGMDAFTQLLESWSSVRVAGTLEPWLEQGLEMAYHALPQLVALGSKATDDHRQAMLEAAFLSGIGLSQAGLGTTHGLAGLVGAYTPAPHGHTCARLMGPCLRETLSWLATHSGDHGPAEALAKFERLNRRLSPARGDAFTTILQWTGLFGIPPLTSFGLDEAVRAKVVAGGSDRDSPAQLGSVIWSLVLKECCDDGTA